MKQLRPDLYALRGWAWVTHLLVAKDELVLMDTGLIGDFRRIQRAVASLGRSPSDLKAILLTHGHLDHTLNAARLQEWSGAKLYAPVGDELHVAGRHPYRGIARVCDAMEAVGRGALRYRVPHVDVWVREGDELPLWGGLRVVSLPGHTDGHVGYYSQSKSVFFIGDAFAVSWRISLPPPFLNDDSAQVRDSIRKLAGFDVEWFVPAHYFWLDETVPELVRKRCQTLTQ